MTNTSSTTSKTVRLPLNVVEAIQSVIDVLTKIGVTKSTIEQLHDGLWQKNHYFAVLKRAQEYSICFKNECNLFDSLYQAWIELHKYYQQKYTLVYKRLYKLRIQQQEQHEEETSSSSQYVICLMIEDTRKQQIALAERITACLIHTMKLQQQCCSGKNNNKKIVLCENKNNNNNKSLLC